MSALALVWAANVRGLKPATKIVLIQLAERHNKDTGQCNPSIKTLAEDCEMDRTTVMRHIDVLIGLGLISRSTGGKDDGGRANNEYALRMSKPEITDVSAGVKSENTTEVKSHSDGRLSRNPTKVKSHSYATRTLREPLSEPLSEPPLFGSNEPQSGTLADEALSILQSILPEKTAADWIAHRKAMKKPMTAQAARIMVTKLQDAADPVACVEASIMNGWQGVFPEKSATSPVPTAPFPAWEERVR